jgi:hypothetical protein
MLILFMIVILLSITTSTNTLYCGPLTNGGTTENPTNCTCQLSLVNTTGTTSSYSYVYTIYDVMQANVRGNNIKIYSYFLL